MVGAFLSTMFPQTGPAVVELSARSSTAWVPVHALFVSVSAGTLVESEKLASARFARPDRLSAAVHATPTSVACHTPSAVAHDTTGSVLSICTVFVLVLSMLPQLSWPKNETIVVPSLLSVNDA